MSTLHCPRLLPLLTTLLLSLPATAAEPALWRETAPADGWAAAEGGTKGGAAAAPENVFHASDIASLRSALGKLKNKGPRIVVIEGVIDATGGQPFASKADQATRTQLRIPSDTTLIGADAKAGLRNAALMIRQAENVIVRNLTIENPWDEFPAWDPNDGPAGHWNSEYDGMTVDASRHVWIDRVRFTDGRRTDDQNGRANGQEVQHHDGALDIKNASDFVTISWSVFALHDKNNLIGHSDKNTQDAGHLRITFHHNLFENIVQRAPRVRFGQVHLYNNLHVGARKHPAYPYQYSHGLGLEARVASEANVFEIDGAKGMCDLVKSFGGSRYEDRGSLLNGQPLQAVASCPMAKGSVTFSAPALELPYTYRAQPASEVAALVRAQAGPR